MPFTKVSNCHMAVTNYVLIGTAVAAGAVKIAEAQLNFIYDFIFYDYYDYF